MRMDIKRVKGRDYLQFVDYNGYIQHIGPLNLENLAFCQYLLGYYANKGYKRKFLKKIKERLVSIGYPLGTYYDKQSAFYYADQLVKFYSDGLGSSNLHRACSVDQWHSRKMRKRIEDFNLRIEIFEFLEAKIYMDMKSRGETPALERLMKIVKTTYRKASEKQKQLWKEEYEEAILNGKIVRLNFEG